jgi:hypothetical protein
LRFVGAEEDHWSSALLVFDQDVKTVGYADGGRSVYVGLKEGGFLFDLEHMAEQPTAQDAYTMWQKDPEMARRMVQECPSVVNTADPNTNRTFLHLACFDATDNKKGEPHARECIRFVFDTLLSSPTITDGTSLLSWAEDHVDKAEHRDRFVLNFVADGSGHTPLHLLAGEKFSKATADLLALLLVCSTTTSRVHIASSLHTAVRSNPQVTARFLNALKLDGTGVDGWQEERSGQWSRVRTHLAHSETADGNVAMEEAWSLQSPFERGMQALAVCSPEASRVPVVPKVLGLAGLATDPQFLDALARTNHLELFETEAVRLILQWKWEQHGAWAHMVQLALYFVFVVVFSLWQYHASQADDRETTTRALSVVSLVLMLPLLITELVQFRRSSGCAYFKFGWNWLQSLSIVAVIAVVALWWTDSAFFSKSANGSGPLSTLVVLLVYTRSLTFLRGFRQTGALVAMLGAVTADILPFLVILGIVILAFSAGFYLLGVFDSPSDSIFATFTMMIGEFYLDDDSALSDDWFSRCLFFVYITVALIVMMNLLIAIISDTFERVIERQEAQFMKERASLLRDTETVLGGVLSVRTQPAQHRYLHVLVPEQEGPAGGSNAWSGRLRQMKDHMDRHMEKSKVQVDDVKAQVGDVKAQVDDVKAQVDDVKAQVDDVKAQTSLILDKLAVLLDAQRSHQQGS